MRGLKRGWAYRILSAGFLLLAAGCTDDLAPQEPVQEPAVAAHESVYPLVQAASAQLPEGLLEALGQLGEPTRVETETVENPHDPSQADTVRTLHYPDWELTAYEVSASGDAFLIGVKLKTADHVTPEGLRVGSSRSEVKAALGAPTLAEGDALFYLLVGEAPAPPRQLVVWLEEDRVAALEWSLYWD